MINRQQVLEKYNSKCACGSTGYYCQRAAEDDQEWSDYFCTITPDDIDTNPHDILGSLSKYRLE